MPDVITDNIDLWTSAMLTKSTAGRGSNGKLEAYGIKKLRELILELAVRGGLVPQDPNDEPASVLLGKIVQAKERLIKEGEIKRQKPLPQINEEEKIFSLPSGWAWCRWDEIALKIGDIDHMMPEEVSVGFPYVSPRDFLPNNQIDLDGAKKISEMDFLRLAAKIQPQLGDIIYPRYGTIGENRLVETERAFLASYSCCVIKTMRDYIVPRYQLIFSISNFTKGQAKKAENKTTQANVGIKSIQAYVVPLPPLAEQYRIVAKVDELMALCDQLEQQQSNNIEAHQTLVETQLGTLTNVKSQEEFTEAWTRIVNYFDNLFTTEQSIDQLKKTILQLAVMGKLVPQDPNDEPAGQLLERIDQTPKRTMRTRATDDEESDAPTEVKTLFELPTGWEWAPFMRLPLVASVGIDRGRTMQGPDKEFAYFKMNNIRNSGGVDLSDLTRVDATPYEAETFKLTDGDFLFNTRNSRELVGKTCVFRASSDDSILYNNNILRVKFIDEYSPDFLDYWFRSPLGSAELEKLKSNTTNVCAIYQGKLSGFSCVVPPLAEQHRIVAKVNELMALCDTLKERLTDAQTTQLHLADTIVEQAVA